MDYIQADILVPGVGYWVKFDEADTYTFSGSEYYDSINVMQGWNIIGPFDKMFRLIIFLQS